MGTSDSLAAVGKKLDDVQSAFDGRALRQICEQVGRKAKPIATAAIEPSTLSGWGRGKGKKVAARYKVTSDHEVELTPTPAALAALLSLGSYKAGGQWKSPKRRGSGRRGKGSVGRYSRSGVPARHAWQKAGPPVAREAPEVVDKEVQRVLGKIF